MDNEYSVYWIHRRDHCDPSCDGYVGITTRKIEERLSEHRKRGNQNPHLKNALDKYDCCITLLCTNLSRESALLEEFRLRPKENIGWNIAIGGQKPPLKRGTKGTGKIILLGDERTTAQKESSKLKSINMRGNIPWNRV